MNSSAYCLVSMYWDRCDIGLFCLVQVAQSAMFSKFIETEKHKNSAWQLQKRLQEASAAVDDRLRQQYKDPEIRQLVR